MSQLGPAPAEPQTDVQVKAKAVADAMAAEAEAKNAAHAALHSLDTVKLGEGPYDALTARAAKLQELAMAERNVLPPTLDEAAAIVAAADAKAKDATAAVDELLA